MLLCGDKLKCKKNPVESFCESQSVRTHQSYPYPQTFTDTEEDKEYVSTYKSSNFNNTSLFMELNICDE